MHEHVSLKVAKRPEIYMYCTYIHQPFVI